MSNTATLTASSLNAPSENRSPNNRLTVALGAVLCCVALVISVQWFSEASRSLADLNRTHGAASATTEDLGSVSTVVKESNAIFREMAMATAAGAVGIVILLLVLSSWWRQRSYKRVGKYQDELIEMRETLEKTNTDLAVQKSERRRLEAEFQKLSTEIDKRVEERTSQLSTSHAQLQKELNDRRQAERVMTQQAKELERSKDVLELHVQARTQELQKLQRRYESILNSAGEGIYGLDLQGRTTFVNPATAKITGWKVEELVGKSESEVFHRLASAQTHGPPN